jgi:hypothetical protein
MIIWSSAKGERGQSMSLVETAFDLMPGKHRSDPVARDYVIRRDRFS